MADTLNDLSIDVFCILKAGSHEETFRKLCCLEFPDPGANRMESQSLKKAINLSKKHSKLRGSQRKLLKTTPDLRDSIQKLLDQTKKLLAKFDGSKCAVGESTSLNHRTEKQQVTDIDGLVAKEVGPRKRNSHLETELQPSKKCKNDFLPTHNPLQLQLVIKQELDDCNQEATSTSGSPNKSFVFVKPTSAPVHQTGSNIPLNQPLNNPKELPAITGSQNSSCSNLNPNQSSPDKAHDISGSASGTVNRSKPTNYNRCNFGPTISGSGTIEESLFKNYCNVAPSVANKSSNVCKTRTVLAGSSPVSSNKARAKSTSVEDPRFMKAIQGKTQKTSPRSAIMLQPSELPRLKQKRRHL